MHLESGCEETCNRGETCTQNDTHEQREDYPQAKRHSCKVKHMAKNHTCIDSLMHDNRCSRHTHTNHTANGKVRTGKENESRYTECKEHTRGSLL